MSTGNNNEKITPVRRIYGFTTSLIVAIIALQALVSIVAYPFLPDRVPSHWNLAGQINGYMPKLGMALLFPLLSFGIFVLVNGLMVISPRLNDQSPQADRDLVNLLLAGSFLLLLVVQLAAFAIALHVAINMVTVISLLVSLLYIFIGNYMGKLRRNFWAGIRTPWTLANETVWERTHRFGGWLFVAGGLLGIVTSFIPSLRLYGILAIILVIVIASTAYSYIVYQRVAVDGRQPPFN
jgi:uncharacterized membrane protein